MKTNKLEDKNSKLKIAVDGEAGTGKGVICKKVSNDYGLFYYSSGIFYRKLAYIIMDRNIETLEGIIDASKEDSEIEGVDDSLIYSEKVAQKTSQIATIKEVRENLGKVQRNIFLKYDRIIMEGRDIGTVIAPDADIKLYFTASVEVRAKRRCAQYLAEGKYADEKEMISQIKERDERDKNREAGPLKIAQDAIVLENNEDGIDAFYKKVIDEILKRA
ncbi:MAG: (d)CMP kinase [Rickettsiaceae bacterium]|nr:(d)CMP kinase [Rickettsiaceae bacterium]